MNYKNVTSVVPRCDYTLLLTFTDGSKRIYDAKPLLGRKFYTKLNDINFFMKAKADCGTVAWNDDIDIAPENVYHLSVPTGEIT